MRVGLTIRRWAGAASVLAVCSGLSPAELCAQTSNPWVLVDDFRYLTKAYVTNAYAKGVAADPIGNIYVVGVGVSNSGHRGVTRESSDGGASWTLVDDFAYPSGKGTEFWKVGADDLGNLFVIGTSLDTARISHWLVRHSQDGGATWATVDDYLGPGNGAGGGADPSGVLVLNSGQVYVAGWGAKTFSSTGKKTSGATDWIMRRSLDGGTTWTTVDDYEFATSQGFTAAQAITASSAGLLAAGYTYAGQWIVRSSPNGNAGSWTTVDSASINSSYPYTAGVDANGYVYAGGSYGVPCRSSSYSHWLVRRSTDGGQTWATVDDLAGTLCGGGAVANGFALDAYNNIVMVGSDDTPSGAFWLTRNSFGTQNSSTGSPGTWITTDEYQYASPNASVGQDICRDSAGNLFAVGYGYASNGSQHWLVRKQQP